jgi:outer membrane protein OmpA-like peptidoglycan-associated protein
MRLNINNMPCKLLLVVVFLLAVCTVQANDPKPQTDFTPAVSLKSNLLYDATTTLNFGVEAIVGNRWSVELPLNYNPWTFSGGRKIKHWLLQPALRYWTNQAFKGSFWGLHGHGAQYNIARIGGENRYQGWLVGGGLSYGYRWNWTNHWGIEAEIGVGYARLNYSEYETSGRCANCGSLVGQDTKNYFGVTKAAVSLVYTIGKKQKSPEPVYYEPVVQSQSQSQSQSQFQPQPKIDTVYVTTPPTIEYRKEEGRAGVWFPVNRATLNPSVLQNRVELVKIARSMEIVRADPSSRINSITITAFSSPEGDMGHNQELALQRAETLRDYMCETYGLADSLFTLCDGGENWDGLGRVIASSDNLTEAERSDLGRIIALADVTERKALLKTYQGGKIYQWLLTEVYPMLRVAEYSIEYTVKVKH